MTVKLYTYASCGTCRKAQKFLEQKKTDYTAVDITQSPPSLQELKAMLSHVGGELRRLFNTSGQVYRELGLSQKLPGLSEGEALALLAQNGKLIKRPFLLVDGKPAAIGFDQATWDELF